MTLTLAGLLSTERVMEENLPQQHRDGVSGPQVLAEDIPQLHCGKGACQLAAKERHDLYQVELFFLLFSIFYVGKSNEIRPLGEGGACSIQLSDWSENLLNCFSSNSNAI